jgi:5'-nucleotidase
MAKRSLPGFAAPAAATVLALGISAIGVSPASAADATHSIAQVQGTADVTPLNGATVTVQGVITADHTAPTGSGYRGFFLQSTTAGTVAGASDGIFVFTNNTDPAGEIGDLVSVTGVAGEYQGQTQISAAGASAVEVITAGAGLPAAIVLPDTVVGAAREAYEGMLVTPESLTLTSSHQLYNFGTLWGSVGGPQVKSTETTDAGEAANVIAADNIARRLLVDDGYSVQISNAAHPGDQPYFETGTVVRNGDDVVVPEAGMVLSWGFNDWRLQPQRPLNSISPAEYAAYEPTFETVNERPEAPEEVGGDFSIGAFNVYNYFTTFGGDARGAANEAEFAVQQSKIVTAINGLDADIVALQEIENSVKLGEPRDEALANLVAALNAAAGEDVWAFVPTPPVLEAGNTDFITNAIIYKPEVASPLGDSFTDIDESVWDIAREPIAQTFEVDDKTVTVVANHLKSKSPPSGSPAEPADGQGFFNAERVEQAQRLAAFTQTITADPAKGEDVILLGDFNAYHEEDPIQVLTDAGYVDLVPDATEEYTYTFNGELGSLDHALVSPSLAADVTGVDVWTINAPEWSDRGYEYAAAEAGTPYRSSDHDPIKVGFSAAPDPVEIDIVSVNDFHGRLVAEAPSATNPAPPGGAAVLGGVVDEYRAANPNTLFVSAGDSIGGSTFTSFIQQDQPTIDVLNEIGLDASAFGNHEFDRGQDDVNDRVLEEADWPYLAANIYRDGQPAYQEYSLHEVDGVTVGFIGAVTEDLPTLVSPAGIEGLEVRDIPTEVNRVADALSDGDESNGEADVLVLLVHEGAPTADLPAPTDTTSKFGEIVNGVNAEVDAIVSAHTHQLYNNQALIPGTDRTRPVIQGSEYGRYFGHLSLSVDPVSGELLSISSEVLPLTGAATPDPEVAAIVTEAERVANELGAVEVGEITDSFLRAKQAAGGENRGGESTLGNLVADAHLAATAERGAEVAFMNPGGLRADLVYEPDGTVTYREAANVQPFANTLVTLDLTGDLIRQVLEQQWQPAGASRPFLKLGVSSNLTYTYDPTAPAGSRIGTIYLDGEPLAADQVVRVVANSFLAAGGDSFTAFAQGTNRADTGLVDLEASIGYFEGGVPVAPDYAQRAVGVSLSAPDADGYSAGDQVTLTLSSLLFSNGGPQQGTAVVSVDGQQLGSAPIDPAIVDTTDEQGRATVTITLPEGTPAGTLVLTVSVPENGTSIGVPIEVTSNLEAIENVKAPKITGQARIGGTLRADGGTWSEKKVELAYQWNRDGVPIEGATGDRYRPVAADAGAEITVTVTASKEGFADGAATSEAVTVGKAATSTYGRADRLLVWGGDREVDYTFTVSAPGGIEPTGEVAIYDGRREVTTVTLEPGSNGRGTVTIPLDRGLHTLHAVYLGDDRLKRSESWPSIVIAF